VAERERVLMKGNEAVAEGAVRAGCRFFFGYPITPQNEIPEYMSGRMGQVGGTFIQAESEVAAINMVYGAAGAGARVMTSSSSPGISLKQEGISYLAAARLPCLIVNVVRGGPGLGGIQPAQSDYFQATRGGGHGDYRTVVLGPASVQEMFDLAQESFDIADRYRVPVMIMADGILGQMMEPIVMEGETVDPESLPPKPWATTGRGERDGGNLINSLYLDPDDLKEHNETLQAVYREIERAELRWEEDTRPDQDLLVVAYGTMARIASRAVRMAREGGLNVGLFRPISLWPYPYRALKEALGEAKRVLVVEMSHGQMVEDVRLGLGGEPSIHFMGQAGVVFSFREILDSIRDTVSSEGGQPT